MKRLSLLLLAAALLLAGCGSNPYVFLEYDLSGAVASLDPQFASSDDERLVIANVLEGLVRTQADGALVPACAESWSLSDAGRTITFTLREGLLWSDGSPVAADDFAFALSRLFNPDAPSPYAKSYLAIRGASAVLAGEAPASSLGLSAPDERTLIISLEEADAAFLPQLARTSAMPCSRAFFAEQKGRYGLSDDSLLTNGPYGLYAWGDKTVKLRRSASYREPTAVDGVNLHLSQPDPAGRYLAGETHACLIDDGALIGEATGTTAYSRSWALLLNPGSEAFSNEELRAALLGALTKETLTGRLTEFATASAGLIAPAAGIGTLPYRATVGPTAPPKLPENPRQAMLEAFETLGISRFARATLLVSDAGPGTAVGSAMQKDWSDTLSAYFNMEPLPDGELFARVQSGDFDFALAPLSPMAFDATQGLSLFATLLGGQDTAGIGALLEGVRRQESQEDAAKALFLAEQAVVDEYLALPVYDTPTLFSCREGVDGVWYDPVARIVYFKDAATD